MIARVVQKQYNYNILALNYNTINLLIVKGRNRTEPRKERKEPRKEPEGTKEGAARMVEVYGRCIVHRLLI